MWAITRGLEWPSRWRAWCDARDPAFRVAGPPRNREGSKIGKPMAL